MLIDKGLSISEVVTFRTINGDEILARLVEETADAYLVNKPLLLTANQQGMGLIPMLFTVNPSKDIKIMKSGLLAISSTDADFAKQYIQNTTGIALA